MFDAVIFDADGVLLDSEVIYHVIEMEVLGGYGLTWDPHDYRSRFMGMHERSYVAALDAEHRDRLGTPLPEDYLSTVRALAHVACDERLEAVAGAAAAVSAVRRPRAVASSSAAEALRRKLHKVGLAPLFDPHIYSADLVAHGKPHPDIFLHAAAALGVDPTRSLAIEDSVNGVRAARAAGMTVWGFTGGGHLDHRADEGLLGAGAERVVTNWDEAQRLFAAL
ncbi:HAD-IA family hydrolase [Caulobacter sp. NIBR1757]|uniref:HAD family hydrolase n=1 Tax=Caulobacter sp. NIBR1757 TaxID=3016000 RepID=UPI0022F07E19|nr:HAD-IA family hydrolase [Caulobacter sp. NIBR1757]WGM37245.1 6-phosphogluconate phosphatase [Caulobacter sp. NIBR1757]